MSTMSRFGPVLARSVLLQQQRHMASTNAAPEPIQKLFLEKIRDFKTNNRGLDETHKKALQDELSRLRRVYQVEDENKLGNLNFKFSNEHNVALYDLESSKELRQKIQSGEYQKQLAVEMSHKSELMESIPEQITHDMQLPPLNKPDPEIMCQRYGPPEAAQMGPIRPDYELVGDAKVTPEEIERELRVKFSDDMPTIHDDKAPGRDSINFPRQSQRLDTPPTRYHVIPESWFRFFYPKTGVSGPYVFAATFGSFLFSKEWLVMEHEMLTAFSSIAIFAYAIPKFGPKVKEFVVKNVNIQVDGWDNWQKGNIKLLDDIVDHYRKGIDSGNVISELYDARRQEIDLQLESEYRRRLKVAFEDTKKRLNYLVSVADSQHQIQRDNMVNWVITNVHSSITPKLETEVLDNCIANLKQLSSKNVNVV